MYLSPFISLGPIHSMVIVSSLFTWLANTLRKISISILLYCSVTGTYVSTMHLPFHGLCKHFTLPEFKVINTEKNELTGNHKDC